MALPLAIDCSSLLSPPIGFLEGSLDPASGGVDCLGAVGLGFRRLGIEMPPEAFLVREPTAQWWRMIGATARQATQVLDVIASWSRERKLHVSALVDVRARLALSSFHDSGVRLVRADKIPRVFAVYRAAWARELWPAGLPHRRASA